jgi:tRNA threonylcarbamoyladenosine biosynthesis protein TsaB
VGGTAGLLAEISLDVRGGHSSALLPAVDEAVRWAGAVQTDLSSVVVGAGPGSFTGLRIAAATAKGIAQALEIPLFAFSSLLATAAQALAARDPVCVLFDARGQDVYAACYRFDGGVEVVMAPAAVTIEEVIGRFLGQPVATFLGDGAIRHRALLEEAFGDRVGPPHMGWPRAASLLWLAGRAPQLGSVADARAWEPNYLRASGAERIAAAASALERNVSESG